jgi:hypothetical protein
MERIERTMGSLCQGQVTKKALDGTVSYTQNARAPRNDVAVVLRSPQEFLPLFRPQV